MSRKFKLPNGFRRPRLGEYCGTPIYYNSLEEVKGISPLKIRHFFCSVYSWNRRINRILFEENLTIVEK